MNYTMENGLLKISISEDGAELKHIIYMPEQCELMWQPDEKIWNGQSPILFPIVGRLWQDKYSVGSSDFSLPKHGFARKSRFKMTRSAQDMLCFTLRSNEKIKQQYPFDFQLDAVFQLKDDHLKICYQVRNIDSGTIWFAIGGHPGFQCQMGDQILFEYPETLITALMDTEGYLEPETKIISENGTITITPESFIHDAYMFHKLKSSFVTLKKQGETPDICVTFYDAEYLGILAKPGAPYVCIEPWSGINDFRGRTGQLSDKEHMISLAAGEQYCFRYDIQVLPKKE